VFLSSGIDSTSLAALASREVPGVHTFTVAFPENEFSEAEMARRTAEKLGTTHQEVMLSGDEMLCRLPGALGALGVGSVGGGSAHFDAGIDGTSTAGFGFEQSFGFGLGVFDLRLFAVFLALFFKCAAFRERDHGEAATASAGHKKRRELAITPIVTPDGGGATLRIDW
jgi:hypothetical protein